MYYDYSPLYVEGFPKDCKRSCKGSIHLMPRKPITVTEGELAYIKMAYPKARIKVVAERVEEAKAKAPAKPAGAEAPAKKSDDKEESKKKQKKELKAPKHKRR